VSQIQSNGKERDVMTDVEFKARIECGLLRGFLTGISTLVDESKVVMDKKKWRVQCVDPAHVAMLDIEIPTELFEDYICSSEGSIGIDVSKILSMIHYAKDRDVIDIRYDVTKNRIVVNDGLARQRTTPVDTSGMSEPKVPNLNLPITFTMLWKDYSETLRRMTKISDHMEIRLFEGGLEVFAEGDIDDFSRKFPKDLLIEYKVTGKPFGPDEVNRTDENGKYIRSLFPLDYMSSLFVNSKMTGLKTWFDKGKWLETCTFSMGDDYPCRIESERNGVKFLYLLAPRITSE
jgi:proliferating cell nuclear antigen